MKPKYLHDNDPWMLAEDIPDIDFQFSQIWLSSFVNDLEKTVGRNYKKILCVYKGLNLKFYYGEKDSDNFAKHVLGLILNNPDFGVKINKQIRVYSDRLKGNSRIITQDFLRSLSNQDLASFYHELDALHTELYTWGWLPNAVDMFHGNFTNHLKRLLRAKITEDLVNETLVALSTHPEKSIIQQEHQSFLGLVVMKQSRAPKEAFKEAFKAHLDKYFYLKHLWIGKDGVYDEQYYLDEVKKFKTSARELLVKENQAFRQTLSKRMKLLSKLKFVQKEKQILDVYAEFAITKMYRRDAQIFWAYKMDFVFSELSRRLKIPFVQTRFMFPHEVISALKAGWLAPNLKKELKERVKYCVYYAVKDRDYLFITKAAKELEAQIKQNLDENVNELVGQTACLGKAKGVAKIVNSPFDMRKMNKGDILVSIATNPDIVPAMKKAAAIVTEQGGITSHAAIVSRELGIPCVIGTKIATKVFKDGDLVEVDANKGTVRKISNF